MTFLDEKYRKKLLERFLRYVKIWTTSDSNRADSGIQPSTKNQFELASLLCDELKSFGLQNVRVTEHCYVYGVLKASAGFEREPSFCLFAHLDTAEDCCGKNVSPVLKEIPLENDEFGFLRDTVISSDGTTLLGADDKAGIAEIMTAVEILAENPEISHCEIEVCFTPDEETGHGMDNVPLNLIHSKRAYTVDGTAPGEIETECFNAYKSEVTFFGNSIHTGSAKGKLVNAVLIAGEFVRRLPENELPETTDGYEGFYAPLKIEGGIEKSTVVLLLRDFDADRIEKKKRFVEELAEKTSHSFGGKADVRHTFQYANMKDGILKSPETVDSLVRACRCAGIEPVFPPVRGGTDGSRLTELGIPAPNIWTGGHSLHSKEEWASLNEMCLAAEVLLFLASENRHQCF